MWAPLVPAEDSWEEISNHEVLIARYGFTQPSGADFRTGKPHGLFSTNSLFNRQSKYENALLTPPSGVEIYSYEKSQSAAEPNYPWVAFAGLSFHCSLKKIPCAEIISMLIWIVLFSFGPHPRWTRSRRLGQWPEVCDLLCMSWEGKNSL